MNALWACSSTRVAADIVDVIAADHDVEAGEPVIARSVVTLRGYGRPVDLPNDVVFDQEIVEAAGSGGAVGAER